jgi:hypothetical protein
VLAARAEARIEGKCAARQVDRRPETQAADKLLKVSCYFFLPMV